MIKHWIAAANDLPGEFSENLPLNKFTSWRVGGPGDFVYRPETIIDCGQLLKIVPADVPVTWLGLGSNTLIRDGGLPGLTIITQGRLGEVSMADEHTIYAEAGVSCAQVARFSARQNLQGAEFLAGVPGTMGGALRMNAGCFGSETWEFVDAVTLINRQGEILHKLSADFTVGYRSVSLPPETWFVAATLKLTPGDKAESLAKIRQLLDSRANTQPTGDHSCGSVFRNPEGDYSGRLIEASGLKGLQKGGAEVSTKHANFIINQGEATATDIEQLILHVQQQVQQNFGIELQQEVKIIGREVE